MRGKEKSLSGVLLTPGHNIYYECLWFTFISASVVVQKQESKE